MPTSNVCVEIYILYIYYIYILCIYTYIFGKGNLLRGCIRRRWMPERYAKYGLFLLSRDLEMYTICADVCSVTNEPVSVHILFSSIEHLWCNQCTSLWRGTEFRKLLNGWTLFWSFCPFWLCSHINWVFHKKVHPK